MSLERGRDFAAGAVLAAGFLTFRLLLLVPLLLVVCLALEQAVANSGRRVPAAPGEVDHASTSAL
ncbi:MAG: hypothetical protein AAB654_17120 [Acidobacteriota bacterium]